MDTYKITYDNAASLPEVVYVGSKTEEHGQHTAATGVHKIILGLRRTAFWLSLSNILLAIAVVVVGVAVFETHKGNNIVTAAPEPSPSAPTSCNSVTTATGPSPTTSTSGNVCLATKKTSTSAALGAPLVECPLSSTDASYTVPGTNLTFVRSCSTDYVGNDMAQFPATTMADCLAVCAQLHLYPSSALGACAGAVWVYGDGPQGENISFCFPKWQMSSSSTRANTESAVLVT